MTTKREAAVELATGVRLLLSYPEFKQMWGATHCALQAALAAFDAAAPDDEEAGREERTEAQRRADHIWETMPEPETEMEAGFCTLATLGVALRDDLKALAAAVKERR